MSSRPPLFASLLLALMACDSGTEPAKPSADANPPAANTAEATENPKPVADATPTEVTPPDPGEKPATDAAPVEPAPIVEPPPAEPAVAVEKLAAITPDLVLSFGADTPSVGWKADDADYPNEYKQGDKSYSELMFSAHTFTRAGTPYTLAVWVLQSDTQHAHAALFRGDAGAHQLVWRTPSFVEHADGPDDMLLPAVVSTGPESLAILFTPYMVGCGGEDCDESEASDTQLFDVTPEGLTVVWSRKGSGCVPEAERHPVSPEQCLVGFQPGDVADTLELVVTLISRKKEKTERFVLRDGTYQAK